MNHQASRAFWSHYDALPTAVRDLADRSFAILKADPRHPSLHFKKVGRFWSARVGLRHRVLAVEAPDGLVWFSIRVHGDYDWVTGSCCRFQGTDKGSAPCPTEKTIARDEVTTLPRA